CHDRRVLVTDFGLARPLGAAVGGPVPAVAPGPGRTGAVGGTPAYVAPEQAAGQPPSPRSDVFSFSVSLYEALYGARPYAGDTLDEIQAAIRAGVVAEPPPGVAVPAFLRRALLRGLRPAPEERYESMDELLAALARDPALRRRRALIALGAVGVAVT